MNLPPTRTPPRRRSQGSSKAQLQAQRRQHWEKIFEEVHLLRQQGWSKGAISRELGIHIQTVQKYWRLDHLPLKKGSQDKALMIEPYLDQLYTALQTYSNPSTKILWETLQAQGFQGTLSTVYAAVVKIRGRASRNVS